jgi:curved DNA-binding protein
LSANDKNAENKCKETNEAIVVLSKVENCKKYNKNLIDWKHADEFKKTGFIPKEK